MTPELLTLMTRKLGNSNEFATRQDVFEIVNCGTDHKWTSYSRSKLSLIELSYMYNVSSNECVIIFQDDTV